jgi:putative ABC transport system permease protein
MVAVVVGLWAINEMSFDRFHQHKDRIYRTVLNANLSGNPVRLGSTFRPFGEQAQEEYPVIEDMCRVLNQNDELRIDNELYLAVPTFMADSNFFSFFTFPLKVGDKSQVLSSPDRVVISETAAARYFPQQDPMGQIIRFRGRDCAVSGVMKDMPRNSSLQTDFVFPFFGFWAEQDWGNNDSYITFFLLQKGIAAESLEEPLTQLSYRKFELFKNFGATYSLESLTDMHFSPGMMFDPVVKGNKSLMMTFILTALVILIISCINFANLFVATSFIRAKAIGIKKTLGAKRLFLMREFYRETACYVLLSIGAGLFFASMIMPVFNDFTQSRLTLDFASPLLYTFLAALSALVVLLAGSFPALYMTRFNVIETLKGKFRGKKMSYLQKSLVITQFTASITLLIVVAFMQKQVNYILSYDLGFDKEHVIYVLGRDGFRQNYKSLEGEFLQEPSIAAVSRKNALPTNWTQGWSIKRVPDDHTQPILMEMCYVNENYFDFFDMQIIDGENPFFQEATDLTDVVINESAARLLGYENPVGEMIDSDGMDDRRFTIRGVVRNAYTKSLHQEVDPQVYFKLNENNWWSPVYFFKISGDPQRAITFIEQKWKEREAEYPFEYHFLDDTYKQLYTSEMNAGKVFGFAMLIALLITVAGLFAMAYYATQRRVREIAIRKVYGASLKDIFILLNKSFVLWVAIAFVIACPAAYFSLQKWLSGFAVKTSLTVWIFLLVGMIALLVTLLTTGYQTWKAAIRNPVEAIKVE